MASTTAFRKDAGRFLARAAKEAGRGWRCGDGGPFGAVICRAGRVIGVAHNTVLATHDPTAHAEINAIRSVSRRLGRFSLEDCILYSTTEPCPMCFSAIHWARIPRLVHATTIRDVQRLGFNELTVSNQQLKKIGRSPVAIRRLKNAPCERLLREWMKFSEKRTY